MNKTYRIGSFVLDVTAHRLMHEEDDLGVDAQQAALLACLAEHYPAIVDKPTLIAAVWGGNYVTDAALQKTVSTLRRRIDACVPGCEMILTRHRRGYQLALTPQQQFVTAERSSDFIPVIGMMPTVAGRETATSAGPATTRLWLGAALLTLGMTSWLLTPSHAPTDAAVDTHTLAPDPAVALTPLLNSALESQSRSDLLRIAEAAERRDPDLAVAAAQRLLALARQDGDLGQQATALKHLGLQAVLVGNADDALARLQQAHALATQVNDATLLAAVTHEIGHAHLRLGGGQHQQALTWLESAVAQRQSLDDPIALGRSLNLLFDAHMRLGQREAARAVFAQLHTLRVAGFDNELSIRAAIAEAALRYQDGADPRPLLHAALEQARRDGQFRLAAVAAQRLSAQYSIQRDHPRAAELLREARQHIRAQGDLVDLGTLSYNEATLAERAGNIDLARALYQRSLEETTHRVPSTLRVHAWLAINRISHGDVAEQARQAGYREAVLLDEPVPLTYALTARADAAIRDRQPVQAQALLTEAEALAGRAPGIELDVHLRRLRTWEALVDDRLDEARAHIQALDDLFAGREQGDAVGAAEHLRQALARVDAGDSDARILFRQTHQGLTQADQLASAESSDDNSGSTVFRLWPGLILVGVLVLLRGLRRKSA